MKLTYDETHDVAYVYLSGELVARTEQIDSGTLVDLDQSGRPVGIEVIRPARDWPLNEILEKYAIDPADEPGLRLLRPEAGKTYPFTPPLDGAAIVEAVA